MVPGFASRGGRVGGGLGMATTALSSGSRSQSSDTPVPVLCRVALGFAADSRSHAQPAQPSWWVPLAGEDLDSQHEENDCFLLLQGTG